MTSQSTRTRGEQHRRDVLRSLGAAGLSAASLGVGGAGHAAAQSSASDGGDAATTITFLHDTHVHGRLGAADAVENVERYFGLMDRLAAEADHAMRLGNGDDLGSSALSTEFEGKHIVEAFEAGGLSHDTYGNHDFDFGPDVLRARVSESTGFQWVSANAVDAETGEVFAAAEGAKRFDVVDVGGVSVGVTGLLTPRASEVTSLGSNTEVLDPAEALSTVVPAMRSAGAQVVVVLSHVANDVATEVAAAVDGVDVVVGDDAAEVLGATEVEDTVLAFVGDGYDHLGELAVEVGPEGVTDYEFALHRTSEAVPAMDVEPHAAVRSVADSYRDQIDSEVVGRSEVPLNCVAEALRTGETNFGNFVADAVREDVDADVAVQNGGGIRTDRRYPAGQITDLLIRQLLPFGNTTVKLEVSGAELLAALENGVSAVETLEGRFPQVSGLTFDWNPAAPAGDRVLSATVGGDPLDPEATYTLGTNNFVADGGDGYESLADVPVLATGGDLAAVVTDRVRRLSPIAPAVDGRIERVSETTLATGSITLPRGASGRVPVMLSAAPEGLAGCRATVSVGDPAVARVAGLAPADGVGLSRTATVGPDDATVEFAVADVEGAVQSGAAGVRLATVEVVGTGMGTTEMAVTVEEFHDEMGAAVDVATDAGRLTVGPSQLPGAAGAPADPDGDGRFEDVNGNGRTEFDDVATLFEHLDSAAVEDAGGAFDFNGNGRVDYDDVVRLYEDV